MMRSSERVDVAIIGGGPAGTAAALALAREGASVVVLERSRYEAVRVGETLPPQIRLLLDELGLWEAFAAAGHTPSAGIVSVWGTPRLSENDFVFDPYGHGWHIDRRRFDQMMAHAAEQAGAQVCRAARVTACRPD